MDKHVLIVEDDSNILELIEYLLSLPGLKPYGVGSVRQFWDRVGEHLPDLIILDIMLPDGNGVDLCRELKSMDRFKSIPVVLMSANKRGDVKLTVGAQDFISKPFDVDDFLAKIRNQLQ